MSNAVSVLFWKFKHQWGKNYKNINKLGCLVALCHVLLSHDAHVYLMWIFVSRKAAWRPNLVYSPSHWVGWGWGDPKNEIFRMAWNIEKYKHFWPLSILYWPKWPPKVVKVATLVPILIHLAVFPSADFYSAHIGCSITEPYPILSHWSRINSGFFFSFDQWISFTYFSTVLLVDKNLKPNQSEPTESEKFNKTPNVQFPALLILPCVRMEWATLVACSPKSHQIPWLTFLLQSLMSLELKKNVWKSKPEWKQFLHW